MEKLKSSQIYSSYGSDTEPLITGIAQMSVTKANVTKFAWITKKYGKQLIDMMTDCEAKFVKGISNTMIKIWFSKKLNLWN